MEKTTEKIIRVRAGRLEIQVIFKDDKFDHFFISGTSVYSCEIDDLDELINEMKKYCNGKM